MSESECGRSESVEESRRWWWRSRARRAVRGGGASSPSDDRLMEPVAVEPRVKIRVLLCRGGDGSKLR
jgi:hypothetical protein